jgi:hypothetical protein
MTGWTRAGRGFGSATMGHPRQGPPVADLPGARARAGMRQRPPPRGRHHGTAPGGARANRGASHPCSSPGATMAPAEPISVPGGVALVVDDTPATLRKVATTRAEPASRRVPSCRIPGPSPASSSAVPADVTA